MTPLNTVDPDVDGDGVLDGYDDQDHDGWTNIDERSRRDCRPPTHPPLHGQTGLDGLVHRRQPVQPVPARHQLARLHVAPAVRSALSPHGHRRRHAVWATSAVRSGRRAAPPILARRDNAKHQGAGGNPGAFLSRSVMEPALAPTSTASPRGCARSCWTPRSPAPSGRMRRRLPAALRAAVEREAGALGPATRPPSPSVSAQQALGLGPLESRCYAEPGVDEVLVSTGQSPIWIERGGRLEPTCVASRREDELRDAIERLLARAGRRADEAEPICDARCPTARVSTSSSRRSPSTARR